MKVLHVASFDGNVGDNANHIGFRPWFESMVARDVEWLEFEIRDVYRGVRGFDEDFVRSANASDLVVIGGGNYFELWVEASPTGTSISIAEDAFGRIKAPIFFNALGVDDAQGVPDASKLKFGRFLSKLLNSPQFLVSVRNDGSFDTLKRHFGELPLQRVVRLPDGGFFANFAIDAVTDRYERVARQNGIRRIGINLAGDMLPLRFPGGERHSYESFVVEFAALVAQIDSVNPNTRYVLFPHIFRDLRVFSDLLDILPDRIRRGRVVVAEYDTGTGASYSTFSNYSCCSLILGMRFHANVVAIANGIPAIGLNCYPQIARLYDELKSPLSCIDVTRKGFGQAVATAVEDIFTDYGAAVAKALQLKDAVALSRSQAVPVVQEWLINHELALR